MSKTKEVLEKALNKAEEYLNEVFSDHIHIRKKLSSGITNDIVTQHDLETEKIIVETIQETFPTHSIVTEEKLSQRTESQFTWFIDPIDGTKNFAVHNPYFVTQIALAYNNEIIASGISAPILKQKAIALKNQGTILYDKENETKILKTTFPKELESSLWMIDFKKTKKILPVMGYRISGSIGIDALFMLQNYLHGIYFPYISSWDIAAPYLILKEAGFKITNKNENEFNVYNQSFLAANEILHEKMINILKS